MAAAALAALGAFLSIAGRYENQWEQPRPPAHSVSGVRSSTRPAPLKEPELPRGSSARHWTCLGSAHSIVHSGRRPALQLTIQAPPQHRSSAPFRPEPCPALSWASGATLSRDTSAHPAGYDEDGGEIGAALVSAGVEGPDQSELEHLSSFACVLDAVETLAVVTTVQLKYLLSGKTCAVSSQKEQL
ncbi:hypothetical protein TREES_T100021014 [Tupaia chinensis]|uniref:Uncharacterized protein n=1 Tax=Tupaia chinensis TaxID=246437 RepID=L9JCR8_TUPCH|nr:hypothetical protein TREES_T100021014 [Tupaia chinensis]